ncbi:MAG: zf-HC2 domain-containing protein [Terracidiphilus sp.]
MKHSEPNPLQQELARSPLAGPHPDFDLLTAFAEGKLLPREREEVFAHLATCADCREVLSIATEATPVAAFGPKPFLIPRPAHQPARAWLPWASIAAGIIIVCSAGLLYKQKLEVKPRTMVATESTPAIPAATPQQKESSQSAKPNGSSGKTATGSVDAKLKASVLAKELIVQKPESQQGAISGIQPELRQQNSRLESSRADEVTPEVSLAKPPAPVQAGSAFVSSVPSRAMAQASVAAVARPHWRINSNGQAERSFGNETWEAVLPNEKARMRVVSVFNGDVWIGGENTRLYHSVDNGYAWNLVALPEKDDQEHVIAHIRFQSSQVGTVEAEDGVTWTTADGGISWN